MENIRWGLIGCGDVARKRVARAIQENFGCVLLAACRRNPQRLREFSDAFAVERRYTDAADLIRDPEIDAVYVATPVRSHLPLTLAAAAAGKHVLVEKPMAMSAKECGEMIRACEVAGVRLGVAYYRRFYPLVSRIEAILQEGIIGMPLGISAVTATPLAMSATDDGYWRIFHDDGGGGALMDVGSHRINLFLHLFGKIAQTKAICKTVAARYNVEDSAVLLFAFESGAVGTLQCHFGATDPDEFAIIGTRGRLVARPLNGEQLFVEIDGEHSVENHPPVYNYNAPLIADFVDAIRESRPPRVDGREGCATNQIIDDAYADSNPAG